MNSTVFCGKFLLFGALMSLLTVPLCAGPEEKAKALVGGPGSCILEHCAKLSLSCMADKACRSAVECNAGCQKKANVEACDLLCELTFGYNSSKYRDLIQCMSDHKCLPEQPPNGKCLANDSNAIQNFTDLTQIKGKWWIIKGLNCGQPGWPSAVDSLPCQRAEFVMEGGYWIDNIAFCGGKNNSCSTPIVHQRGNASLSKPGVMKHWYTDPPLKPQVEEWRVLSWPHPDWILLIYCGSTPAGLYAGGSVSTRAATPSLNAIPQYVEKEFRAVATKFGIDYDAMCVSDVTTCSD